MTTLYFVRHGQTQWNVEKRLQGHKDSPLTQKGILQATALASRLQNVPIDTIYSSSAFRAVQTARILQSQRISPVEIETSDALREINLGEWEGMTKDEVAERFPDNARAFWHRPELYVPQGGESFEQAALRVSSFVQSVVSSAQPDACYLFVSHGMAIQLFLHSLKKAPIGELYTSRVVHQASLTTVQLASGAPMETWKVVSLDDREHLEGLVQNTGQVV